SARFLPSQKSPPDHAHPSPRARGAPGFAFESLRLTQNIVSRRFASSSLFCGGGEIRTLETLSSLPPFQGGALDHYATPPYVLFIPEMIFLTTRRRHRRRLSDRRQSPQNRRRRQILLRL